VAKALAVKLFHGDAMRGVIRLGRFVNGDDVRVAREKPQTSKSTKSAVRAFQPTPHPSRAGW
jgi:hypothetical protein